MSVDELFSTVKRGEEEASRIVDAVLGEIRERLIISYTGVGSIAAYTMYWILREVAPQTSVELYSGDALAFHVLAYRRSRRDEYSVASDTSVVLFAGPGGENQLLLVRDAALYTGAGLIVVSHRLPPVVEQRLGGEPLLVELEPPYPLYATILAARLGAVLASRRGERNVRVERVSRETADVSSVVRELVERHGADAERLLTCRPCIYAYTPTMTGPARLAAIMTRSVSMGVQECLSALSWGVDVKGLALLYTSADEDAVRELRFKAMTSGLDIRELKLGTDPVTAPLYATILLYARGGSD